MPGAQMDALDRRLDGCAAHLMVQRGAKDGLRCKSEKVWGCRDLKLWITGLSRLGAPDEARGAAQIPGRPPSSGSAVTGRNELSVQANSKSWFDLV